MFLFPLKTSKNIFFSSPTSVGVVWNEVTAKVSEERAEKEDSPSLCVFNDALTIELNFNGKSRLMCWFSVSYFQAQKNSKIKNENYMRRLKIEHLVVDGR